MSLDYLWHVLILVNLYGMLALSLNLIVGYTGLLSICQAAFYGIGAYASVLIGLKTGWGFLPALLAASLLTAVSSLIIALPSLRLRGDYFVLATLAFQIIVYSLLYNWEGLTRGPYGIGEIPAPRLFGTDIDSPLRYLFFSSAFTGACLLILMGLTRSPFGRALKAVREDEMAALALGKSVAGLKILTFAITAAFAAVPGALFAGYARYIDPTSFTLAEGIFVLSIVAIGGAGNLRGPLIGAVVLVALPEALRFLRIPDAVADNARQILYGLVLIVVMRFRPQGLQGEYRFE
jgi:branched-chain amino acid transport system permease protein